MNEKFRIKIIAIVLVGVSVWAFYQQNDKTKSSPSGNNSIPTIASVQTPGRPLTDQLNIKKKINESWGHDPFKSIPVKLSNDTYNQIPTSHNLSYVLSGIIYNKNLPIAVINNNPYKIGESIGSAKVTEIYPDSVTLLDNNGKYINLVVTKG